MIYLASPYSASPASYYAQTLDAVRRLIEHNYIIFSPILHCRPLETDGGLPGDFEFWRHYNYHMIKLASELWVLELEGWENSTGVKKEIEYAELIQCPTYYINPLTLERSA